MTFNIAPSDATILEVALRRHKVSVMGVGVSRRTGVAPSFSDFSASISEIFDCALVFVASGSG